MRSDKYSHMFKTTINEENSLRDYIKYTYSTPVKSKYAQPIFSPTNNTYTNQEISQFLSCIIQLKDHISYINILLKNLLEEQDMQESIEDVLKEALYKNTQVIEKFANVTGRVKKHKSSEKRSVVERDEYLEKVKEISRQRVYAESMKEDSKESLDENEYKILKQEIKYLKGVVNKMKKESTSKELEIEDKEKVKPINENIQLL